MKVALQSFAPSTGNTISPSDWCEACSLNPAATLATLTINMPKQPVDGQPFRLNTSQIITALTLQVTSGTNQTLLAVPASLAIGVSNGWVFKAAANTWFPS